MLKGELRMTTTLHSTIVADLSRPHCHAYERVGFVFGKLSDPEGQEPVVYLYRYMPVKDEHYIPSEKVSALIDSRAIVAAMQEARRLRGTREGVFHVHMHMHRGEPWFGKIDCTSLPDLIPCFQRMDPTGAHGLLLLSADHGIARIWLPGAAQACQTRKLSIVGAPTRLLFSGGEK